jgi:hypothetical protein
MVKIVLDTNLLVAGRWNKNSSSMWILDFCIRGAFTPVYTEEIKRESLHILGKVKPPAEYMEKVTMFYDKGELVRPPHRRIHASVDMSDNRFLEAAVAGKADYLISNDHHLLDLREYEGIRIIRPGAFMRTYI